MSLLPIGNVNLFTARVQDYREEFQELLPKTELAASPGYVLSPYDKSFEERTISHRNILIKQVTLVELFQWAYPDVFDELRRIFATVGDTVDFNDYRKLKHGAKLGYLAAAAAYAEANPGDLDRFKDLYDDQRGKKIFERFDELLQRFKTLAAKRGPCDSIWDAFDVARSVIRVNIGDFSGDIPLDDLRTFLRTGGYNKFQARLGCRFEKLVSDETSELNEKLWKMIREGDLELRSVVSEQAGEGEPLPLDANPYIRKCCEKSLTGISVPDLIHVVPRSGRIFPCDLKLNPLNAKGAQLDPDNLVDLIESAPCTQKIFNGYTVNGDEIIYEEQDDADEDNTLRHPVALIQAEVPPDTVEADALFSFIDDKWQAKEELSPLMFREEGEEQLKYSLTENQLKYVLTTYEEQYEKYKSRQA